MKTMGRYLVVPVRAAQEGRFTVAALGYTDSLAEACEQAHVYASPRSPVRVYDTEDRIDRYTYRIVHETR